MSKNTIHPFPMTGPGGWEVQINQTNMKQDPKCQCGHLHSEHGPTGSINYSAGRCVIPGCECLHFLIAPAASPVISEEKYIPSEFWKSIEPAFEELRIKHGFKSNPTVWSEVASIVYFNLTQKSPVIEGEENCPYCGGMEPLCHICLKQQTTEAPPCCCVDMPGDNAGCSFPDCQRYKKTTTKEEKIEEKPIPVEIMCWLKDYALSTAENSFDYGGAMRAGMAMYRKLTETKASQVLKGELPANISKELKEKIRPYHNRTSFISGVVELWEYLIKNSASINLPSNEGSHAEMSKFEKAIHDSALSQAQERIKELEQKVKELQEWHDSHL